MAEKIIIDIAISEKELTDKLKALETQIVELNDEKKKLNASYKAGELSAQEFADANVELTLQLKNLKEEQKDVNKDLQNLTALSDAAENSYEALVAQYNIGQKALKSLADTLKVNEDGTIELTEEYQKQAEALETLKAAQIEFDLGIKNGKSSVGLYSDAIEKGNKQLIEYLDAQNKAKNATNDAKGGLGDLNDLYAQTKQRLEEVKKGLEVNADGSVKVTAEYKMLKEEAERLEKAVKKANDQLGNEDAAKKAVDGIELFGVTVEDAGNIFDNFSQTLLKNPLLLVVAGIVLFVKTMQELFEKFKETEEGAEAVGQVTARLGQIFNALYSAVKPVFKFIIDSVVAIIDKGTAVLEFFGVLGDDIGDAAKQAAELDKQYRKAEQAQRALTVENAKNKKEQEALKNIRDDESKSLDDRIAANEKIGKLELERLGKTMALEKEKLRILEEKAKLEGSSNLTQEQQNELAEQRTKLYELEEESLGRQNEQITNRVALEKEIFELRSSIKDLELEQEILQGRITEGSREALDKRNAIIKEKLDQELKDYEGNALKQREIRLTYENQILQNTKDFNDKQAEVIKEAGEKQKQRDEEQASFRLERQKMALENDLLKTKEGSEAEFKAKMNILEFNYKTERDAAEKQKKNLKEIDTKFNLEKDKLENDFKQDQLIKNADFLVRKKQQELANEDLTKEEKLQKQQELYDAQVALQMLQLADTDMREEERKLILEERELQQQEIEFEKQQLKLEEEDARLVAELEREGLQFEEKLILEQAYEENRKQMLLNQRGLTQEQIEQIEKKSSVKQAKTAKQLAEDKAAYEREYVAVRMQLINEVFNALEVLAAGDKDLSKALFFLRKGIAIGDIILNLQKEIAGISSNPVWSALPDGGASLKVPAIAAAKIRAGVGVATVVATAISEGGGGGSPKKAASGGYLVGPSHSEGGIKGSGSFGNIEVEGGEFIVNKRATAAFMPALKMINSYASGGIIPDIVTSQAVDTFAQSSQNMPDIFVAVKDINDGQSNFASVQEFGTLG